MLRTGKVFALLVSILSVAAGGARPQTTTALSVSSMARPWKVGKSTRIPSRSRSRTGRLSQTVIVPTCSIWAKSKNHNFKNFHFKADVMTTPGSNSGLYIHTKFQESGWPAAGYEVQVNQTHGDPKKSSGLYGVRDVMEAPAKDNEWYTQEIIVQGKHIITKVNGKTLVDYVEPDDVKGIASCRVVRSRSRPTTPRARCSSRTSKLSR